MRARWAWIGAVAVVLAATVGGRAPSADDDVPAVPAPAAGQRRPAAQPPGIDLAAHVDVNVVLPPNHWRVGGDLRNVVIAGGRLNIEGNLTIGGEFVAEPAERIRRTDEAVMKRLRSAQREALARITADATVPAAARRALELATEADVCRVATEVARLRDRYSGERANLGDDAWRRFQKDVQECRRSIADPFGDDSLFAAVRAGLDAEPR